MSGRSQSRAALRRVMSWGVEERRALLKQVMDPPVQYAVPRHLQKGQKCQDGDSDSNGSPHRPTTIRKRQGEGSGPGSCWVVQPSEEHQGLRLGVDLPTVWFRPRLRCRSAPEPWAGVPSEGGQGHQGSWVHSGPLRPVLTTGTKPIPDKFAIGLYGTWQITPQSLSLCVTQVTGDVCICWSGNRCRANDFYMPYKDLKSVGKS